MEITLEHTLEAFSSDAWNELLQKSQTKTVFQTYFWHGAWVKTIGQNQSLFILKVHDQGRLVGIAPLVITTKKSLRILKFIGHGHADYCDFIYERVDVLEQIIKFLKSNQDQWDGMALDYIPQESATAQRLAELCGSQRLFVNAYAKHTSWCLHMDADQKNVHTLMERKSFQRDYKNLKKQGEYQAVHLRQKEEIEPWLNEFFDQHIRRRADLNVKSLFLQDKNKQFYQALVDSLASAGGLLLTVVLINQKPVAFHWGWVYNGTLMYYKPSYDLQWAKYSPGDALLMESFRYFLDQGLCEFDFGMGDESYKKRYANSQRELVSFKVFKSYGLSMICHLMDSTRRLLRI